MIFPHYGLALAPMRALTQSPFWRILNKYGAPDAYFSEFVRVHENYVIDEKWIEGALSAAQDCPLWIQLMGNDTEALAKSVRVIEKYPVAGIDFNVGCPVPKIFKKQAGGGLLRDLPLIRTLLLSLRENCTTKPLSVKFRLGFDSTEHFSEILEILSEAHIDLATLHARTVTDLYKAKPRYEFIQQAVRCCKFPVLGNGSIDSLKDIEHVLRSTGCYGVMLGRVAIRNPWIFSQWHQKCQNLPIVYPTFEDVYHYIKAIYESFGLFEKSELTALGCLKRFVNYIGLAIDDKGEFLKKIRITHTLSEFWNVCKCFLLQTPKQSYDGEAFENLYAQPNKELDQNIC